MQYTGTQEASLRLHYGSHVVFVPVYYYRQYDDECIALRLILSKRRQLLAYYLLMQNTILSAVMARFIMKKCIRHRGC